MLLAASLLYLSFSAMATKNHNVFRAPPFKRSAQTKLWVPNLYFQERDWFSQDQESTLGPISYGGWGGLGSHCLNMTACVLPYGLGEQFPQKVGQGIPKAVLCTQETLSPSPPLSPTHQTFLLL